MKIFFTLLSLIFLHSSPRGQNFNGQWKGGFTDNSSGYIGLGGNRIDYVLELDCRGANVSGYSYTYFTEGPKRFYTICKLMGNLNRSTREISVTEFERTKYNTPPDFRNCFQTHRLKYMKDSENNEVLEGTWIPAPNQHGDCGYGKTTLIRRIIQKMPMATAKVAPRSTQPFRDMNKEFKQNPVKQKPVARVQNPKPSKPKDQLAKNDAIRNDVPYVLPVKPQEKLIVPKTIFEKRAKALLKTIPIEDETFKVDLYDNGEIDGDSISVFYNGRLLLSHQRLSDKPITLKLAIDENNPVNELTMYAENLGEIPPNTALMVITDGDKRYEVRIISDTQKNGTIAFVHKPRE
ncbi:MAG: hypothetical protein ABJA57_10915 [Ginsengibacter sp.]